jgi:hypothetical protein
MGVVFISYRSGDDAYAAALLDSMLSRAFGPDSVFRASRSIEPGDDYVEALANSLGKSSVVLAVVGPRWLSFFDGTVEASLTDGKRDWVRQELGDAFRLQIPVIPVLLSDAMRLREVDLPIEIHQLARCQYLRLDYRNIDNDLAKIAEALASYVSPSPVRRENSTLESNIRRLAEVTRELEREISGLSSTADTATGRRQEDTGPPC